MIESHKITIPKTAHYATLGVPSKSIRHCWIVCHGYGQLAKNFIRRFDVLDDGETFVVAPEGLSKFYWGGFTGDPVASWMTKENRLDEIADYCRFLQTLYEQYLPQLAEDVQVTLLGFSQGAATQCRWMLRNFPHFHRLILWAGMPPDDLDFRAHSEYLASKKLHFVYGTEDQFLAGERMNWLRDFIQKQGLEFEFIAFEGKHEVEREVLKAFVER